MKNSIKEISQFQTSAILEKNAQQKIKGGIHVGKLCHLETYLTTP